MSRKLNPAERLMAAKPNPNVIHRRLDDEMVLFHLETDHFYELNGTAARFWELLSESNGGEQIHDQMIAEFAVDPKDFASEAEVLLTALRNEDLVFVDG